MKISLKLLQDHQKNHHQPPVLLRAKIPVTILNLPFLSHFSTTTTHPSDLSLSLSTNFPSFPSLKFSYATSAAATPPLSVTLKSGTGLFGSPNNSPLVISAHFSFNPSNPNHPNPTFSLFFKPQLGSFSLRKSTFSHTQSSASSETTNGDAGFDSNSFGFVPLERPETVKDLSVGKNDNDSIFKGIRLAARTQMPVAKRVALNFRWWVNFAEDQMPVLRINKIGIQRIDDVLKDDENKMKKSEANTGEVEVLKGMCIWMKNELDSLTRVNREMKCELEEMKVGHLGRNGGGDFRESRRKKAMPCVVESPSSGFEQWRNKRNGGGEENGKKEEKKKNGNLAIDVENELERAIKAAASSSPFSQHQVTLDSSAIFRCLLLQTQLSIDFGAMLFMCLGFGMQHDDIGKMEPITACRVAEATKHHLTTFWRLLQPIVAHALVQVSANYPPTIAWNCPRDRATDAQQPSGTVSATLDRMPVRARLPPSLCVILRSCAC
ncbi:hypothetical protein DH2020_020293 [Rehmannia glutinosa]|uniref:Uncharacterized protein n=1 Tax=Rehmannia glutinosa TaxID=99300 RepID=A0ABR0WH73_REHGL